MGGLSYRKKAFIAATLFYTGAIGIAYFLSEAFKAAYGGPPPPAWLLFGCFILVAIGGPLRVYYHSRGKESLRQDQIDAQMLGVVGQKQLEERERKEKERSGL